MSKKTATPDWKTKHFLSSVESANGVRLVFMEGWFPTSVRFTEYEFPDISEYGTEAKGEVSLRDYRKLLKRYRSQLNDEFAARRGSEDQLHDHCLTWLRENTAHLTLGLGENPMPFILALTIQTYLRGEIYAWLRGHPHISKTGTQVLDPEAVEIADRVYSRLGAFPGVWDTVEVVADQSRGSRPTSSTKAGKVDRSNSRT